jgi:choline dehydrogenase
VRSGYLPLKSRGWVKLRSADPADPPRIFLNMFSAPGDMQGMIRSIRLTREIYAQEPLARLIARETMPGDAVRNDAQLEAFIRENATHRAHPACSCRMGLDEGAVVDAQLRVHGIEGLRIADASVMPSLPRGNPNLACMMIGEKLSDLILGREAPAPTLRP